MGDRGQVLIEDTGIYLYTHWGATGLPEVVRQAIARYQRWSDVEYLTRIIFSEMIQDDVLGETGYGIGNEQHGDVWRLISINVKKQTVTIKDGNILGLSCSFKEFISKDLTDYMR